MSVISWSTPKGTLGTIPDNQYYNYQLLAVDSDEQPLFYSKVSGQLPPGVIITREGYIRGIPIVTAPVSQTATYSFSVRAANLDGQIADRSFSLTVNNVKGPEIITRPDLIGAWFDGNYLDYQFESINDNPQATETWSVISGSLPPGTSLSSDGRLSGFVEIIAVNTADLGYEARGVDIINYDALPESRDKYYNFTLQVTDGARFDTINIRILIVSKGNYTADNFITVINNTFVNVDADNKYRPIILNRPVGIPMLISGDTFAYKLAAYDPEDEDISWSIDEFEFSGMDELDAGFQNSFIGNGTVGPYTLTRTPTSAAQLVVRVNGVILAPITDYSVLADTITFASESILGITRVSKIVTVTVSTHSYTIGDTIEVSGVSNNTFNGTFVITNVGPTTIQYYQDSSDDSSSGGIISKWIISPTDNVEVLFIDLGDAPAGTGFDTLLFDQGVEGLPAGLVINKDTGWIYGTLPTQVAHQTTYNITVTAYRTLQPANISDPFTFSFTVQRDLNEEIVWNTPSDLGFIDNGAISEIALDATNNLGKELEYSIVYNPYRRVPQGLKLLRTGRFIGRVTFRYFSLDGSTARINLASTAGIEVGMSVQGVDIAAGCEVSAIIDSNTVEIRPSMYIREGAVLTFSNELTTKVATTTSNAVATAIDGGNTTFDFSCSFTAKATAVDGSISSTKDFFVRIRPRNLAPYENLWLKSLLSVEQRKYFMDIIKDQALFPPSLLYRPDDPYFGISKSLKMLFLAGLSPAKISEYTKVIERNHYTKLLNFDEIKTARALDSNGNVAYEVVYVDVIDPLQYNTAGPALETTLSIQNGYLTNTAEYKTIYPNSFNNMKYRIDNGIGYTNRGALPRWMTSVQENGLVLGSIKAVVLAYVKPGAGRLVQYRLKNTTKWPAGKFSFVADRYQWENYLSKYYDLDNLAFLPSRDTTFDKYPNLDSGVTTVVTQIRDTVSNSSVIRIPDNINVGYGWKVSSLDTRATIDNGSSITSVTGNLITVTGNVTASAGSQIKLDGSANADYAVFAPFNQIDGATRTYLIQNQLIDGVIGFKADETILFVSQNVEAGWIMPDGVTVIPGYLEKFNNPNIVNQRAGVWKMTYFAIPETGFDSDDYGFDYSGPNLYQGYFDSGEDFEIHLEFVQELIVNQTVKIRSGKTYPSTTLQFKLGIGESSPRFVVFAGRIMSSETTFDGGSCLCREGDERSGVRGGTAFSNNRDKYEVPETLDKYIKFPQNGVFV